MIRITGDTHGDHERFFEDQQWSEEDTLIVCGDFGYIFRNDEKDQKFLDALEKEKPYTICFCDGNHENFPAIYSYPEEEWKGGKIHRIRKNIIHLMRGQIYEIEGKKIFTMGGAYSIDRYMRVWGRTYWEEELPNNEEYHCASENLKKNGMKVDLIITHTAPAEIIRRMGYEPEPHDRELTGFLEWILYEVDYQHWYFGHWHIDRKIDEKITATFLELHEE